MGIYQKILSGKIVFPKFFDKNGKVLVKKLLTADLGKCRHRGSDPHVDNSSCRQFAFARRILILYSKILFPEMMPTRKSQTRHQYRQALR